MTKTVGETIGLDVGGTKIFGARFNGNYEIEAKIEVPTEAILGKESVLQKMIEVITQLKTAEVDAIGIAWPGFVQSTTGKILHTPNIPGCSNFSLTEVLQEKIAWPIFVENDARLFTLAEAMMGGGKGLSAVLGIIFGTGIGSGFVWNGELLTGHDGLAGELGHTMSSFDRHLEIEQVFSGPGLEKFLYSRGVSKNLPEISELLQSDQNLPEALKEWGKLCAEMLINLVIFLNPSVIVLGGSVSKHILRYLQPFLEEKMREILLQKKIPAAVRLHVSELENAGALGAAFFARK